MVVEEPLGPVQERRLGASSVTPSRGRLNHVPKPATPTDGQSVADRPAHGERLETWAREGRGPRAHGIVGINRGRSRVRSGSAAPRAYVRQLAAAFVFFLLVI